MGAFIIDADILSRDVVMPGQKALQELTGTFGSDIIDEWGQLRRKKLAELVFNNQERLNKLNAIVHKYVSERIKDNVKEQLSKKTEVIVIDAPIPVKEGFLDQCQQVWTVTADRELRINRIMERNGMTYEEAVSRINSQLNEQEYIAIADTVINNNDDYSTLKEVVKCQLSRLLG
jgi:dephospho-CoA kinase